MSSSYRLHELRAKDGYAFCHNECIRGDAWGNHRTTMGCYSDLLYTTLLYPVLPGSALVVVRPQLPDLSRKHINVTWA